MRIYSELGHSWILTEEIINWKLNFLKNKIDFLIDYCLNLKKNLFIFKFRTDVGVGELKDKKDNFWEISMTQGWYTYPRGCDGAYKILCWNEKQI